jgi:hypothetical protein
VCQLALACSVQPVFAESGGQPAVTSRLSTLTSTNPSMLPWAVGAACVDQGMQSWLGLQPVCA